MKTIEQIASQTKKAVEDRIEWLKINFGIDTYITTLTPIIIHIISSHPTKYKAIPEDLKQIIQSKELSSDSRTQKTILILTILLSIKLTLESDRFAIVPDRIKRHQLSNFDRMVATSAIENGWLSLENDYFQKELGIATLRLFCSDSQVIEPNCGIQRSFIFRGGVFSSFKSLFFILKNGGFKPYFQIHAHEPNIKNINFESRIDCYQCCIALYELYPQTKGIFASSWFYDPNVLTLCPNLKYLSETPLNNGAARIRIGIDEVATRNALKFSKKRRSLYEQNKYEPTVYMIIWSKRNQIRWQLRGYRNP